MKHKESALKEYPETKGQERKHEVDVESKILVEMSLLLFWWLQALSRGCGLAVAEEQY